MTTDPILLPFTTDLPPADEALDALYAAFSGYSLTDERLCRQCFDEDYVDAVRRIKDPRQAPFELIMPLCYESPYCAGYDRAMALLPRTVELGFWEDYELCNRIIQLQVWGWPEDQQAALRRVLSVAVVGWFRDGDPAPLKGPPPCPFCKKNCSEQIIVGEDLLRGLFLLRVDPFSLFPWLVGLDSPRAAMTIGETVPDGACVETGPYLWPHGPANEAMIAGAKALNSRIEMAACSAVPPSLFSDLFFKYADTHAQIAKMLSEALDCDPSYRTEQDDAALADGLKLIAAGIAAAQT